MTRFDKPNEARAKALEADIKQAGLSARALGRLSGVDDKQIRNVLNRRDVPLDATWARLAAALPGALQASGRAEPKAKSGASRAPDSKLVALLVKQGIDIPAPAPASPASAHGVRRDDPADIALLAHNELVPGDNYRKTFTQAEIEQLAESIAERGLLQNIVARPKSKNAEVSVLRPAIIVAGERRWRAIGELVKQGRWNGAARNIAVRLKAMNDGEARALALIENLQRQDVPVLEEAEGFKALTALGWDTAKIADAVHIAQRTVQDRLQLFDRLKPVARAALTQGTITLEQARAIVSTPIEKEQNELVTLAVRNGYNAAALRDKAKCGKVRVSVAEFDLKQYKGEFIGTGAERVFADTEAFLKLQRKAAKKKADALAAEKRFAKVTLLDDDAADFDYANFRPVDEDGVTAENAARLEVFVGIDPWERTITVEYGEPRTGVEPGADGDDEDEDSEEAAVARAKRRDAEREEARAFMRRIIAAAQENPLRFLKHRIAFGLTGKVPALLPVHLSDAEIDNLPATAVVLVAATGEAWTFASYYAGGDDFTADPDRPEDLAELPRNEALGYLIEADAARLTAWLDGQSGPELLALYAGLEASRAQLFHTLSLNASDIALADDLGVEVPDFMRPEDDEEADADSGEEASAAEGEVRDRDATSSNDVGDLPSREALRETGEEAA
ncbi:ParB/RepB/Spo0J family partition protein [Parvibaculum sp.]|uniref:ParB/RepB/Spo0J family partition protein n=1 Tax=Parvibaculum sp. TaxID=2024848 RepID=UPI001D6FA789|nr:ParB/RepB/Spo0J family partition protein [Parvibaculum sp.]MBX3488903.1 ParB/RepB/Spo0J family partition protein [Parvibaculum sp.]